MLLSTVFDSADVHSSALAIAFATYHVVTVAYLLSICSVGRELQLGARKEGGLIALAGLPFLATALSFAAASFCEGCRTST